MIQLENISYLIDQKELITNFSTKFESNKINLIIGPNGAGKSTLIKLISGQLKPSTGRILYNNKDVQEFSVRSLAQIRTVLSQNIDLAFPMAVREVVMMGRYPHFSNKPSPTDNEACDIAIDLFELWDLIDRDYLTLSGGEQQRTHFARVFAQILNLSDNSPRYLILDEPLNSLDVYYQYNFMNTLTQVIKEQNIVVIGVLHDLNLVSKYADHIHLIDKGQLIANGNPSYVLSEENIESVFKIKPNLIRDSEKKIRLIF